MLEQRCSACAYLMLVVKSPLSTITPHLAGTTCKVACINCSNEAMISGNFVKIDVLSTLRRFGGQCVYVPLVAHGLLGYSVL